MSGKTQKDQSSILKDQKSVIILVILAVIGICLLILPEGFKTESNMDDNEERLSTYAKNLENKIAELCSKVKGVSNVSVSVYFDTGFETVYAFDEESKATSNGINSEKKYVTIGSGNDESMVCVVEKMPTICGIAIVCTGGGDKMISRELISMISSAFGVPSNKIYVTEGKK